jgi:hypothetical protein
VYASAVLPNGDLVVGGNFELAGGNLAFRVTRWDGTQWQPMGVGLDGVVYALLRRANGDLVLGGAFSNTATGPVTNLARWNGVTWEPLGGGTNGAVRALLETSSGDLVVGGEFTQAGGVAAARIARWDGGPWPNCRMAVWWQAAASPRSAEPCCRPSPRSMACSGAASVPIPMAP